MKPSCPDCQHSYDGADGALRCRITGREARMACTSFVREAGADAEESPWFKDGWCVTTATEGRGD